MQQLEHAVELGHPMRILALNLPFIMVVMMKPGQCTSGPIYLDIRKVRLMSVPDEMVEALGSFRKVGSASGEDVGEQDSVVGAPDELDDEEGKGCPGN